MGIGAATEPPFGAELGIGWSWRLLATTAAIAGLTLGAWQMSKRYGEFAIERLSGGLQWGLSACTGRPARYVLAIARSTDAIERGLDARGLALSVAGTLIAGILPNVAVPASIAARLLR